MFLKLDWLGAALALMPLLIQPEEVHRMELFPNVPEDISGTTFLIDLEATTLSNTVLIKCPYTKYNHKTPGDLFIADDIIESKGAFFDPEKLFAWVPLLRQSTNKTNITCGNVHIKTGEESYKAKKWIFNVLWKNGTNGEGFFKRERSISNISPKHPKCNLQYGNPIIFSSKKEGGFSFINDHKNLPGPYANQTYFYFIKPSENERIKEPCGIMQIYGDDPEIKLPNHKPTSNIQELNKTNVIKLAITGQQSIDVVLDMRGDLKYYRGEKIILTKMKYVEKGLQFIENSNTLITSNFSINGYEIVKLTYYAPYYDRDVEITERYYFAPSSNDLTINEKTVEYFTNEASRKPNCPLFYLNIETIRNPNCPLFYLNIGYLYKFKHNETEKDYSN
uniref:Uncharacterized protein n=1 Tax=Strongyloides papillosus TaxID=174720 RepID=A0A0N5B9U2_STREA